MIEKMLRIQQKKSKINRIFFVSKRSFDQMSKSFGKTLRRPKRPRSFNLPRPNQFTSAYGRGPSLMLHPVSSNIGAVSVYEMAIF